MQSPSRIILAMLAGLASGCASTPDLPVRWSAPEPDRADSECEAIAGVYENVGENLRGQKTYLTPSWFPSLNPSLFVFVRPPVPFEQVPDIRSLTITRPSRHLVQITADTQSTHFVVRTLDRERKEFECQGGVLSFSTTHLTGTSSSVGTNTKTFSFYKSGGYLIEHIDNRDFVIALILPLKLGWSDTHRFKEVTTSDAATSAPR